MTGVVEQPFSAPLAARLAVAGAGTRLFWLGQAGFVVARGGRVLLIDPYLSDSLAEKYRGRPFDHVRMMPPPAAPADFPRIDLVLITHAHTDHMDPGTLQPIAAAFPGCRFVVPRAVREEAERRIGCEPGLLLAMDAGERCELAPNLAVQVFPAAHEKLERDAEGAHLFLGYGIETPEGRIYHSGDSVPFDGLAETVGRFGPAVTLLPVNGRRPELTRAGIAGNFTLDEAIDLSRTVGAHTMIAHHHGMFAFNSLAAEAIDARAAREPVGLKILRAETGIAYRLGVEDQPLIGSAVATPKLKAGSINNGGQNVIEVIRTMLPELRKSDRKVAKVVLDDPQRIMNATVAETAQLAEVSQPTVIRFCVFIGCEGYQDFKLRLAQSLALGTPATHSVILATDDNEEVASKIFDYTMTSLGWARNKLDYRAVGAAIDLLSDASRIEFFGFGASGIVARDAQQKFPLFGVPCGAETDSHQQIMVASMLKPGDVVVVVSNTGTTRSVIEIARLVREQGCRVIGLMGSDAPLADHCDVCIVIETLENTNIYTPTISRIAALVVIDILSTAVALRRGQDHMAALSRMKRKLSQMRLNDRL